VAHHLLVVGHIPLPNSIAANDNEVVVSTALSLSDFRQGSDCLLLVGTSREVLVLEVPKRAGEGESAVDPALLHVPARLLNPVLLRGRVRLVVGGEGDCVVGSAEHCPRVADVGDVVAILGHQHHHSSGARSIADLLSLGGERYSQPLADDRQFLLAPCAEQQVVDPFEDVGERLGVVLEFEVWVAEQLLGQHLRGVVGHLRAAVAVEDSEQVDSIGDLLEQSGVLHRSSPASV
jgi:hypothetical protein